MAPRTGADLVQSWHFLLTRSRTLLMRPSIRLLLLGGPPRWLWRLERATRPARSMSLRLPLGLGPSAASYGTHTHSAKAPIAGCNVESAIAQPAHIRTMALANSSRMLPRRRQTLIKSRSRYRRAWKAMTNSSGSQIQADFCAARELNRRAAFSRSSSRRGPRCKWRGDNSDFVAGPMIRPNVRVLAARQQARQGKHGRPDLASFHLPRIALERTARPASIRLAAPGVSVRHPRRSADPSQRVAAFQPNSSSLEADFCHCFK